MHGDGDVAHCVVQIYHAEKVGGDQVYGGHQFVQRRLHRGMNAHGDAINRLMYVPYISRLVISSLSYLLFSSLFSYDPRFRLASRLSTVVTSY